MNYFLYLIRVVLTHFILFLHLKICKVIIKWIILIIKHNYRSTVFGPLNITCICLLYALKIARGRSHFNNDKPTEVWGENRYFRQKS